MQEFLKAFSILWPVFVAFGGVVGFLFWRLYDADHQHHDKRLSAVEGRTTRLEEHMGAIHTTLASIQTTLAHIDKALEERDGPSDKRK
jgi:hypothetical protein